MINFAKGISFEELKNFKEPLPGFKLTKKWLTIQWGGYDYDFEIDRIESPLDLLELISHVGQKRWPDMTPGRISDLIRLTCEAKGWRFRGC